jgi:hypothetical protein
VAVSWGLPTIVAARAHQQGPTGLGGHTGVFLGVGSLVIQRDDLTAQLVAPALRYGRPTVAQALTVTSAIRLTG